MDGFIVVGNANSIAYKEIFPLFKDSRLQIGYNSINSFNTEEGSKGVFAMWFSTFPVKKKPLVLSSTYDPDKYPVYDNYPAINVDRIKNIPYDYDGVMGVPITILNYDLNNIEIVGLAAESGSGDCSIRGKETYVDDKHKRSTCLVLNGKRCYAKVIVRRKEND